MFILKLVGIVMIVLCFSLLGFFKANAERESIRRLEKIAAAVNNADSMLRLGAKSREEILTESFKGIDGLTFIKGRAEFSEDAFDVELKRKFQIFSEEFGSADITAERQRIKNIEYAVKTYLENSKKRYINSHKIWQTAGVCAGIILGIMLI